MLTLAEKGRQKIFEFRWAIRLSLAEKGRRLNFESGWAIRLLNNYKIKGGGSPVVTHWSSCEVPKGARMISGASTMLTLAAKNNIY